MDKNAIELCAKKLIESKIDIFPVSTFERYVRRNMSQKKYNFPFHVDWKITSRCNLRCKHCYYIEDDYLAEEINTSRAKEIVDELAELGVVEINVTGGELFVREDIFEILAYIKQKQFALKIATNATLIDENIVQKLKEIVNPKIDAFQISLDGAVAPTHDKIRGEGSFEKTISGIKKLLTINNNLFLNYTVNKINMYELPDFYELAKNLGVPKVSISKLQVTSDKHSNLIPDTDELFTVYNNILLKESQAGYPKILFLGLNFSELLNYDCSEEVLSKLWAGSLPKTPVKCDISCAMGEKAFILSNGKVTLCPQSESIGVVSKESIKDCPFSTCWQNFQQNFLFLPRMTDDFICQECKFVYLCQAKCPALIYASTGSILGPALECKYCQTLQNSK